MIDRDDLVSGEKFHWFCGNSICYYRNMGEFSPLVKLWYSDTYCQHTLFNHFRDYPDHDFVAVLHNADVDCAQIIPDNCVVFSTNVRKTENPNPRIIPIPIGLENSKWFPEQKKQDVIHKLIGNNIEPTELCYANFNPNTNVGVRTPLEKYIHGCKHIRMEMLGNGEDFNHYVAGILRSKFILSPPGNGIDCHRTWEALYLGRIPIVFDVYHPDLFRGLPVLTIQYYSQLEEDYLLEQYEKIKSQANLWSNEKLTMNYWHNLIGSKVDLGEYQI